MLLVSSNATKTVAGTVLVLSALSIMATLVSAMASARQLFRLGHGILKGCQRNSLVIIARLPSVQS